MENSKRNKKEYHTAPKVQLTPEQIAANKVAQEQREAELKAERERIELYGKNVQTMSHAQLSAELKKTIKRESFKEAGQRKRTPAAGLTIAFATILDAVFTNTRTSPVTEDGRRLRKDQINPTATKTMNPGW
jgi:hypothetical protein